jgi:cytochrome c oxidase subunit 3
MSTASSHAPHEYHHAHHFPSARAEAEASKLGMWIFLATEILLFSGLFCAYACYRYTHAEMFKTAHQFLDWKLGAVNTMVLIFSSLTMALAVRASQLSKRTQTIGYLLVTLLCGGAFLVVKYFEYSHKIHMGTLPQEYWNLNTEHFPETLKLKAIESQSPWIFFGIYFLMTGLHGLHVVIGMAAISWVLVRSIRGDFSSKYYFPVELVGLYWHLVDLIWIYLFPLLYLVG